MRRALDLRDLEKVVGGQSKQAIDQNQAHRAFNQDLYRDLPNAHARPAVHLPPGVGFPGQPRQKGVFAERWHEFSPGVIPRVAIDK